ncbi:U2 small nuclear ribonucleoprotein auxiliary factor 35 kDa subunit-related protein 2 isoform 2-T2 [Pelodytes ibericus]
MAAPVPENPEPVRMNHKKIRAVLKKEKRRKKRQALAKLRDTEENKEEPFSEDELEDESISEIERQRLHEEWLLREQKAQEEFMLKKEKEEAAKRREDEERRLIEEWRQQEESKEKNEEQEQQQKKKDREEAVQKMLDEAENQLENGDTWHNPEAPEGYGTEKDRANCPFYLKTGACRFGERCSRKHVYPSSSQTLLIRGMFVTYGMEQCRRDDYDTDASLEYGEEEIYQQFMDFYADVVPEFKNVGKVVQFKVSCNFEPHLRGNVYVQYQTEEECLQAFSQFNGRWYASRQLQCEFSPVTRWKTAICGLFERQKCPRGKHCNFLHVFKNPNNEFWEANRDFHMSPDKNNPSERRDRSGWFDEHGHSRRHHSSSPDNSSKRNGESRRKKSSHHHKTKKHRSHRSRSLEKRSRSRGRKKHKHKNKRSKSSRSRSRSRGRRSKSRERSPQSPKGHK